MGNWNQPPNGYGPPPQQPYYQQPQGPQVVYVQAPATTVVIAKAPFNHTIHIVLDVLTCGGWLIVHLICWACH